MTASGTAGHGAELAPLPRPRRRSGAVVVKSLSAEPWAGQPAAAGARDRRRDDQQRRAPGPGRGGVAGATTCRRCSATGARVVASDLGPHGRRLRAGPPTLLADAPGRGRRGRGQPVVPEHRGRRATCSPTRPTATAAVDGGHRRLRPAPLGQAQPQRHRPRRRSPPPPRDGGRRGGHAGQHGAGHGHRPRDPRATGSARAAGRRAVGPGHPPGRGAGRPRRPRRAPRPADRRRRRRGRAAPTRPSCCWPARRAVQVGTATFADPRAPAPGAATSCETWCAAPRRRPHRRD